MTEQRLYDSGQAPAHLATLIQLAQKKLVPTRDPVAAIKTRDGRQLPLYDWRQTKHSRFVNADELKKARRGKKDETLAR